MSVNRLRWWEWALLAVVVFCASVLIVEQAHAYGRLLDLLWWLRRQ